MKRFIMALLLVGCGTAETSSVRPQSTYDTLEIEDARTQPTEVLDTVHYGDLLGIAKEVFADITDKEGSSVNSIFEDFCEQTKTCPFHATVEACALEAYTTYMKLTSGCQEKMLEMVTDCAPDPATPCLEPTAPGCKEMIATFQGVCMGFKTPGDVATRWQQVCEAYKMKEPQDCDPSVTMDDVIELCEFVGATLKDTPECIEKVDLYLECLPQTKYYCPPGQLVPRPDPSTGCYKEAEPFTFPTGECVQQ
ncbi:MAG: hypothetical protein GOVbin630_177 [Prokaryotic dsDNA virus sp.]|nr:MAG: hypothetical protein GOVbin630_177 [Prokaryotic dsDNA virus sp.]|tara:strand:- start:4978 stop:5730 length:753 start_codon:yes stop_codon:yes gene_type:complete